MPQKSLNIGQKGTPAGVSKKAISSTIQQATSTGLTKPAVQRAPAHTLGINFNKQSIQDPATLHRVLQQMVTAIGDAHGQILANPTQGGNLLKGCVFGSPGATLQLSHGLGRPYTSFIMHGTTAPTQLSYGTLATGLSTGTTIPITSSAAATVDIWVY
jgi:hypothetical protein